MLNRSCQPQPAMPRFRVAQTFTSSSVVLRRISNVVLVSFHQHVVCRCFGVRVVPTGRTMWRRASQGCLSQILPVAATQSGAASLGANSLPSALVSVPRLLSPNVSQEASSAAAGWPTLSFLRNKYTYAFKRAAATPGLIFWKPRTNGLRHKISIDYKSLGVYTGDPIQELSFGKANTGGRNEHGHITVRGRGGGMKKVVRMVDYKQPSKLGTGVVQRVELDPNRSGFLALVRYDQAGAQPEFKYHIAPHGLREGDMMASGTDVPIQPGSRLALKDIPLGTPVHNIEMSPGKGGAVARAAGVCAHIKFKEEQFAVITMPSGEVRRIPLDCMATIGTVSNPLNKLTSMGKAGINRLRGRRPKVRGVAMNPVDHPHGGKTAGGRPSCTPWGVYCKGQRTRLRNKWTNKYIITRKGGVPIDKFVNAKKWRAAAERDKRTKSGTLQSPNSGPPQDLLGPRAPAWGQVSVNNSSVALQIQSKRAAARA